MSRNLFPDWMQNAACAKGELDEAYFSEETSDGAYSDDLLHAKATCLNCPVRRPCLEYAYDLERTYDDEGNDHIGTFRQGVFGGSTGEQRQSFAEVPDRTDTLLTYLDSEARELQIAPVNMRLIAASPRRKEFANAG